MVEKIKAQHSDGRGGPVGLEDLRPRASVGVGVGSTAGGRDEL